MQASTKVLENKRFFQLDPVPKAIFSHLNAFAFKYLKKANHRRDILNGLDISQLVK